MNTQSFLKFVVLTLVCGLLLAACGGGAAQIKGDELTAVTTFSAPMAENIVNGMKNADHDTFAADFDDDMQAAFTPEKFNDMLKDLNSKLGACVSYEFTRAEKVDGGYIAVSYRTKFEKATVTMRLVHHEAEPHLVSGLWFR
jgi:hypothetical protein